MMSRGKAIGTAIVVLAVVIVIGIGTVAFVTLNAQSTHPQISATSSTSSLTTSSTELSTGSSSGSSTTYSNNSDSGLQLRVVMNASTIQTGDEVAVQIEVLNTLSHNVSLTDAPNQNISAWNGGYYFCGENPSRSLVGFALFDGHFTMGNISAAGSPLQLMAPAAIPCPISLPLNDTTFLPNSDETVSSSYQGQTLIGSSRVIAEVNATTGYCTITSSGSETTTGCSSTSGILGYWNPGFGYTGNMTLASSAFTRLLPGEYTLVAMDDWNGTVYTYFQVIAPSQSTTTSTSSSADTSVATVTETKTLTSQASQPTTTYAIPTSSCTLMEMSATTTITITVGPTPPASTTTTTVTTTSTSYTQTVTVTSCTYSVPTATTTVTTTVTP